MQKAENNQAIAKELEKQIAELEGTSATRAPHRKRLSAYASRSWR